jgi:hypothetical protein
MENLIESVYIILVAASIAGILCKVFFAYEGYNFIINSSGIKLEKINKYYVTDNKNFIPTLIQED